MIDLQPYLLKAQAHTNKDIFGIFLFGSQNYGLADEDSDIDIRCLVFPDNRNSKLLETEEIILPNEERIEYMDIRVYFQSLCEGNLTILETLRTDFYIIDSQYSSEWLQLKNRIDDIAYLKPEQFFSNIQSIAEDDFIGYYLKAGHPKLIKQCGYAAKNLHHLFRRQEILERYKNRESFKTILYSKNAKDLLDIKRGRWSEALANACVKELEKYFVFKKVPVSNEVSETAKEIWRIIQQIYRKRGWNE